ncbi:MAG: transcriptional repressor NrdR [Candidatus Delongbacteria bacterium]|nr:transcriptional repressor NrdR [Candidatus Delongbacteria bacterium]MBN2836063.1 transcriptional repressor NrdR [Candidatus Delongbacteria bacterium]
MKCPRCSSTDNKVIDSRVVKEGDAIRRRRVCLTCNSRFTTYEYVERSELSVEKSDGSLEDFDMNKVKRGINLALRKRVVDIDIDKLVREIYYDLADEFPEKVSSSKIGEAVMNKLKDIDEVAYVRFASVYRKFSDVKEFMQEITRIKGS